MTDSAKTLIETSEYEPYGQVVNAVLKDGPGYTGHVLDAATGLNYMQQRHYDPLLGMFLSADPVMAYGSPITQFHRYRYANSNPYSFTDPDGRQAVDEDKQKAEKVTGSNIPGSEVAQAMLSNGYLGGAGEMRASTRGETLRSRANHAIDSNSVLGLGGKELAHYFGDDVVDYAGHAIDGNIGPAIKSLGVGLLLKRLGPLRDRVTYLYQKIGPSGEHLKFGITSNPASRYTAAELSGGRLKILASGSRTDMLRLERNIHETLPLGVEERQLFYIQKQLDRGLLAPPYP